MRADEKLTAFLELESVIRDTQHPLPTFFAMRYKVSGSKRETVYVSGFTWNQGHQNKKGNIVKNRKIQFKATAPRCRNAGLLLACLAAVFISAPNLASARDEV